MKRSLKEYAVIAVKRIVRHVKKHIRYKSETSKVRHLVLSYCHGYGADIGFGGDKIVKKNCLGIDFKKPYAFTGRDRVDIGMDIATEEIPLSDKSLDFVYSSHLIEDFEDTAAILRKMIRVIRPKGYLILVFPDQPKYEVHCAATGQTPNPHHVHADMGAAYMEKVMRGLGVNWIMEFEDQSIDYNVVQVYKILNA